MKIDRMELADLGNPMELARAIIKQLPDLKPPVPIIEIAHAVGIIEIKAISCAGFEGGLIAPDDKSNGCIVYNEASRPARRVYTIGHELGHFLNPWHSPGAQGQFMCTSKNMIAATYDKNDRQQKMEVEANQFAAELLMPGAWIKNDVRRKAPEISHIVSLAGRYAVSKEAMGRRYVDFQDEPCALIFSKNGKILYAHKQKDSFPGLNVWSGDMIPQGSVTASYKDDAGSSSDWREYPGDLWLSGKYHETVYEQVLIQEDGYRMTLLTVGEEKDEEDERTDRTWRVRL